MATEAKILLRIRLFLHCAHKNIVNLFKTTLNSNV